MGCIQSVPPKSHALPPVYPVHALPPVSPISQLVEPRKAEEQDYTSLLRNATYENTPPFNPQFTQCKVVKIYDGDTLHVAAVIGDKCHRFMIRMFGYDSPELKSKDIAEKKAAIIARDVLSQRINGKIVTVEVKPIKEKYGRVLAVLRDNEGCINDWMIANGYGKPYNGGTKEAFQQSDQVGQTDETEGNTSEIVFIN